MSQLVGIDGFRFVLRPRRAGMLFHKLPVQFWGMTRQTWLLGTTHHRRLTASMGVQAADTTDMGTWVSLLATRQVSAMRDANQGARCWQDEG